MKQRSIFLMLFSLLILKPAAAENTRYVQTDAFLLSEPVALRAIDSDWDAKYHPDGERQIAAIWLERGLKKGSWSYGALFREEQQLGFHSDTADLYYAIANDQDLTTNRQYKLALDAYRFRGYGGRVAKTFEPSKRFQFSLGGSLFYATNLLTGSLSGGASANSADEYTYQFDTTSQYHQDDLLGRKISSSPDGIGLSLDLAMAWKPSENLKLSGNIRDLAGAIYWKDVPYTDATANSDTVTVDENGFSLVKPVLTGFEGYKSSYTQRIRPSANFSATYNFNDSGYAAGLKTKHYEDLDLFSLGGSKQISRGKLALHYWPQINTLEADYQSKNFKVSLGLDQLDLSKARALWLSLSYR